MITVIASSDQPRPHAARNSPPDTLLRPIPKRRWPASAISRPIAATVKPWSSFTNTSGIAHSTAALVRPRTRADSENASSGTANAISWKSKSIICCRPQENPNAKPIVRPAPRPSSDVAAVVTGNTDTAVSSACATSSVSTEGNTRKNGAISATMTWKWSPSRLNPAPRTSTIGARRFANCFTYSV